MMLHFILSENWWPRLKKLEYNFLSGLSGTINKDESLCNKKCYFANIVGKGDKQIINVLQDDKQLKKENKLDFLLKSMEVIMVIDRYRNKKFKMFFRSKKSHPSYYYNCRGK